MRNSFYFVVSLMICFVIISTLGVFAGSISDILQGSQNEDEILEKVDSAFSVILFTVFPLVGVLLVAVAGVYLAIGSAEGKSKVAMAIGGIGCIALAPRLVAWIIKVLS